MIDLIKKGKITASFKDTDKTADVNNQLVPLATLVKAGNWDLLASFGLFKREKQVVDLRFDQKITSYETQVIDGKSIDVPIVKNYTVQELKAVEKIAKEEAITAVREYADEFRGEITTGTTAKEREGWQIKADICNRFKQGKATPYDLAAIATEIDQRAKGETQEQLAEIWFTKAGQYASAICLIDGMIDKAEAVIDASSLENLEAAVDALKTKAEEAKQALLSD